MRDFLICGWMALATVACGQQTPREEKAVVESAASAANAAEAAGASAAAGVPATAAAPAAAQVGEPDRASILKSLALTANAQGQVRNECDEMVAPQFIAVDLGAKVGPVVLLVMSGGPKLASCYGDGPGLTLVRRTGAGWKQIYSSRGAFLAIMKELHNGAPDLVNAGPGLSHPVFEWKGSTYEPTKRTVPDEGISNATILP